MDFYFGAALNRNLLNIFRTIHFKFTLKHAIQAEQKWGSTSFRYNTQQKRGYMSHKIKLALFAIALTSAFTAQASDTFLCTPLGNNATFSELNFTIGDDSTVTGTYKGYAQQDRTKVISMQDTSQWNTLRSLDNIGLFQRPHVQCLTSSFY